MKILAITTGQGQRKDQRLGEQLVGSRTSGQGYPQIAPQSFPSGRSAGKEDQRAGEMKIHHLPTKSTPCAQNDTEWTGLGGAGPDE